MERGKIFSIINIILSLVIIIWNACYVFALKFTLEFWFTYVLFGIFIINLVDIHITCWQEDDRYIWVNIILLALNILLLINMILLAVELNKDYPVTDGVYFGPLIRKLLLLIGSPIIVTRGLSTIIFAINMFSEYGNKWMAILSAIVAIVLLILSLVPGNETTGIVFKVFSILSGIISVVSLIISIKEIYYGY